MGVVEVRDTFTGKFEVLALVISYRNMSSTNTGQEGVQLMDWSREQYR